MDLFLQYINLFISSIIASFLGYIFTWLSNYYNIFKPRKVDIMEAEYKNVYLPIYRILLEILIDHPLDKIDINRASRINSIIENNFYLVHPIIYNNNKLIYESLISGKSFESKNEINFYVRFYRDIAHNYEDLRRLLKYPSNKKANPILLNCRLGSSDDPIIKIILCVMFVTLTTSFLGLAITLYFVAISVDPPIIFFIWYYIIVTFLSASITKIITKNNLI